MKIELEINQKDFDKAIIREIARQIIENEYNQSGIDAHTWNNPAREVLLEKARKVFQKDLEFEKEIMEEMKSQMNNKKLIKTIAKEMLESKLRDFDND